MAAFTTSAVRDPRRGPVLDAPSTPSLASGSSSSSYSSGYSVNSAAEPNHHPGWPKCSASPAVPAARADSRLLPVAPPLPEAVHLEPVEGRGYSFKRVSTHPLPVDCRHVHDVMQHQPNDVGRCANCTDMDMPCNYVEPGIFCDLCILSGSPRCKHTDPFAFAEQLTSWRANFLVNYVRRLHSYIEQRFMHASVFLANYEIALEWANRAVQGAIIRFESNIRATSAIATRGYGQIINATTGLADLGRFLTFAAESSFLHPSIVKAALKRGAELVDE